MRRQAGVATALAVAALGMVFWAKSGVHSAPIAPAVFIDRWASVEEAQRSGAFVVKYAPNAVTPSYEVSDDLFDREKIAAARRFERPSTSSNWAAIYLDPQTRSLVLPSGKDGKAATIILDARKKAIEDIRAGARHHTI
jgi:hypothetical protein